MKPKLLLPLSALSLFAPISTSLIACDSNSKSPNHRFNDAMNLLLALNNINYNLIDANHRTVIKEKVSNLHHLANDIQIANNKNKFEQFYAELKFLQTKLKNEYKIDLNNINTNKKTELKQPNFVKETINNNATDLNLITTRHYLDYDDVFLSVNSQDNIQSILERLPKQIKISFAGKQLSVKVIWLTNHLDENVKINYSFAIYGVFEFLGQSYNIKANINLDTTSINKSKINLTPLVNKENENQHFVLDQIKFNDSLYKLFDNDYSANSRWENFDIVNTFGELEDKHKQIVIKFDNPKNVNEIQFKFWLGTISKTILPKEFKIQSSLDGINYNDVENQDVVETSSWGTPKVNDDQISDWLSIKFDTTQVNYLKIKWEYDTFYYEGWRYAMFALTGLKILGFDESINREAKYGIIDDTISHFSINNVNIPADKLYDIKRKKFVINSSHQLDINNIISNSKVYFHNPSIKYTATLLEEIYSKNKPNLVLSKTYIIKTFDQRGQIISKYLVSIEDKNYLNFYNQKDTNNLPINNVLTKVKVLESFFDRVNNYNYKSAKTYQYLKNLHQKIDYESIKNFDTYQISLYDDLIDNAYFIVNNLNKFNFGDEHKNSLAQKLLANINNMLEQNFVEYSELKGYVDSFKKLIRSSDSINSLKNSLKEEIQSEKLISSEAKEELLKQFENKSSSMFVINSNFSFNKSQTKWQIKKLKNSLINSNLSNDLKNTLLTDINLITDYYSLVELEKRIKNIIEIDSKITEIITDTNNKINESYYGANKAFAFYNLLDEYKQTYDNHLKSISKADEFLNKLINWQNSINDSNSIQTAFETMVDQVFKHDKIVNDNLANWQKLDLLRFMNVGSLNNQTANIMLLNLDTNFIDFSIEDVKLSSDFKQSIVTYKVTHKYNPNLILFRELRFNLPNEKIVNKVKELEQNSNLDDYFDVDYYLLSKLNYDEFKNQFSLEQSNKVKGIELYANYNKPTIQRRQKYVKDSFEYRIQQTPILEKNKLVVNVEFTFNNNVILKKQLFSKELSFQDNNAKQEDDDQIDLAKAREVLANKDLILHNLYLKKDLNISHQDFYPEDAIEVLNKLYDFPKFGKYTIAPKQLIRAYDSGDRFGGVAEIFWGILKTEVTDKGQKIQNWVDDALSDLFTINHFKRYQHDDFIKPINQHFLQASDFVADGSFDLKLKSEIDLLDDSDIDFRKVIGKAENYTTTTQYRNINIKEFLNQKAQLKANCFLRLIDPADKKNSIQHKISHKHYKQGEYVPYSAGHIPATSSKYSSADTKAIKEQTFYYFYDIKQIDHNSISFRLGFVSNKDKSKRYSPNKVFVMNNVVNDYEQNLYPEVMLNNLIKYNIKVDDKKLSQKTVEEWKTDLKSLSNVITLVNSEENKDLEIDDQFITYKNFQLNRKYIRIGQIKQHGSNSAFIRFEVLNFDNKWVLGKNWYLISNFKTSDKSEFENINLENEKLQTIYYENKLVKRIRELEPHVDDALWTLKSDQQASWKMDSKYIRHTFLTDSAQDREFEFEMYAGMLVFDNLASERIVSNNKTIKFKVDFEQLLNSEINYKSSFVENIDNKKVVINYTITVQYSHFDQSVNFYFTVEKPYKIKLGYPQNERAIDGLKFDVNRAVMLPYAPLKIKMSYTNQIQNESDFGLGKTNLYDYNKANTSATNQVHLLYNDASYYASKVYNPNQNVYWKHNDGFIPNIQWIRDDWGTTNRSWDIINRVRDNGFKYVTWNRHPGTGGMLTKINDDPNDLSLYYISNWHVGEFYPNIGANANGIYPNNATEPPTIGSPSISLPLNKWDSELYKGYSYTWWDYSSSINMPAGLTKPIYIGYNRANNNSPVSVDELVDKDGNPSSFSFDLQLTWSDFKKSYEHAKQGFRDDILIRFRNYLEAKPTQLDHSSNKNHHIVPLLNPHAHIGFPGWGFMTGYVNFRPEISNTNFYFRQYANYSPIQFGEGNSGSVMWNSKGNPIAIWTAGAKGSFSTGLLFDTYKHNFYGVNWNNENPLDLKSFKNSVGHIILRQALNNPFKYSVPWFYKKINS
ncbi:Hypothetical protein, predicted lipoprotein [Mycoplasmopsis bovigenitalium 51080]|uniref:DUF31 domain-containing protein n=1 Tax=Mycoplasmopsis bovigenitalium 51080 TaxID=1188235 RepID=N9VBB9_9BACT|nr:discoidin domain-containing protein [Mycoplasmopsis bovigenitalium]ENY68983.1 Hypothetical protein, predicted lipoprotein [Mycoplasmopsis bovigenitalium 51080]